MISEMNQRAVAAGVAIVEPRVKALMTDLIKGSGALQISVVAAIPHVLLKVVAAQAISFQMGKTEYIENARLAYEAAEREISQMKER